MKINGFLLLPVFAVAALLYMACPTGEDSAPEEEIITYTVTFDLGYSGGTAPAPIKVAEGQAPVNSFPADPVRDDYQFSGWYAGQTKYTQYSAIGGDLTLTAAWEALYTVTFIIGYDGAASPEPIILKSGQSGGILFPPDPVREDYIFRGWFAGTEKYDPQTPISASVNLTAQWFQGYAVTFVVAGGMADMGEALAVERNQAMGDLFPAAPVLPAKFTFTGWYDDQDNQYTATTPIAGDITLTGKWTKAADVDRITSRNSAYPVFKFTVPGGDSFGTYTKITVKLLFNDENENTAQMPPPNIRLYGNFAATYFTDSGAYFRGAVATNPYLQFNITANTAPPVSNDWYTFEIPFDGAKYDASNFSTAFPAAEATGDFYFALGPGMGGGTGSATHHTYYISEVTLSDAAGTNKIVSPGHGFSKPAGIYNAEGDFTRE